jgi:hypothetical protein
MTTAGKILVFTILAFSLVFLAYAVIVFVGPVDVGWDKAHTRQQLGQPVDSELKKSEDKFKHVSTTVHNQAVAAWQTARRDLTETEARIAENQVWYNLQLSRLQVGPVTPDGVRDLKKDAAGRYVLEKAPQPKSGRPVYDPAGKPLYDKDYAKFVGELNGLFTKLKNLTDEKTGEITLILQEEKDYTEQLNGKTEAGTKEKGLYDLINRERDIQQRARDELAEVKPKFYQELVDSQLLLDRQKELQLRIKELENIGIARR